MLYICAGWVCHSCITDQFIPAVCLLSAVSRDSQQVKKLRALHVMSILREGGRAEMWHKVSHHFVDGGTLYLEGVLTKRNLGDLVFLLSSPSACQITCLL